MSLYYSPFSTTHVTPRYHSPSTLVVDVETRTPLLTPLYHPPTYPPTYPLTYPLTSPLTYPLTSPLTSPLTYPLTSPLTSPLMTPSLLSPVVNRYTTRYTTAGPVTPAIVSMFSPQSPLLTISSYNVDSYSESGLNYDPLAQEQIRDYIHNTFFNKWLPKDFPSLLRYLKVVDGQVKIVEYSSSKDKDGNKIVDETSKEDNEKKLDFIEDNILSKNSTRKVLIKVINENNIKWYNLPHNETLVKHVLAHYVKGKLEDFNK